MTDYGRRWAVILAGGDGLRLRLLTRELAGDDRPEQYCRVHGGETLLDQTRRPVALSVPPLRTLVRAALGGPAEARAVEAAHAALPPVDFSREVLAAPPERLAAPPVVTVRGPRSVVILMGSRSVP